MRMSRRGLARMAPPGTVTWAFHLMHLPADLPRESEIKRIYYLHIALSPRRVPLYMRNAMRKRISRNAS